MWWKSAKGHCQRQRCTANISVRFHTKNQHDTDLALDVIVDEPLPSTELVVGLATLVFVTLFPPPPCVLLVPLLFLAALELLLKPELLEPPLAPLPFSPLLPLFPGATEVTRGASFEDASAVPDAEPEGEGETGVGRGGGALGGLTGLADGDASDVVLLS